MEQSDNVNFYDRADRNRGEETLLRFFRRKLCRWFFDLNVKLPPFHHFSCIPVHDDECERIQLPCQYPSCRRKKRLAGQIDVRSARSVLLTPLSPIVKFPGYDRRETIPPGAIHR